MRLWLLDHDVLILSLFLALQMLLVLNFDVQLWRRLFHAFAAGFITFGLILVLR